MKKSKVLLLIVILATIESLTPFIAFEVAILSSKIYYNETMILIETHKEMYPDISMVIILVIFCIYYFIKRTKNLIKNYG